jgi:hypothetical protein
VRLVQNRIRPVFFAEVHRNLSFDRLRVSHSHTLKACDLFAFPGITFDILHAHPQGSREQYCVAWIEVGRAVRVIQRWRRSLTAFCGGPRRRRLASRALHAISPSSQKSSLLSYFVSIMLLPCKRSTYRICFILSRLTLSPCPSSISAHP